SLARSEAKGVLEGETPPVPRERSAIHSRVASEGGSFKGGTPRVPPRKNEDKPRRRRPAIACGHGPGHGRAGGGGPGRGGGPGSARGWAHRPGRRRPPAAGRPASRRTPPAHPGRTVPTGVAHLSPRVVRPLRA